MHTLNLAMFATYEAYYAVISSRAHRDTLPPPPQSYWEAKRHPFWPAFLAAITKEHSAITNRTTYRLVPKDPRYKTIPLKWVYTYKFDSDGYLSKFKARLCVRGDKQELNGLDTYAAILAAETMRFLLAIAAHFDLEMRQFDAVNAFLNCILDEIVYCDLPPGFERPGQVWHLLLALYGLRRAPHLWANELSSFL